MSISPEPLSYCSNVHPGVTLDAVIDGIHQYTGPLVQQVDGHLAAGLWLAQPVIAELNAQPERVERLQAALRDANTTCYTLNAFPYGDFHGERVKEQVYLPDWSHPDRLAYTADCARVLAQLLPANQTGSISTVPLGFKHLPHTDQFVDRSIDQLLSLARELAQIEEHSERLIRLAIEPEPLCELETTAETVAFFQQLYAVADGRGLLELAQRYLGVCYDVCHQAVEFEDVPHSINELGTAGVRINKVHITCAIELPDPTDLQARASLESFIEPRYLHQTIARSRQGQVSRWIDLSSELTQSPPSEFEEAECWRIHFHVPVNTETIGPLRTTRPVLQQALEAVAQLDYAPHLEIETYTWAVLPGAEHPDLVTGLAREVTATREMLQQIAAN